MVISKKTTEEGEVIPFHQTELKVKIISYFLHWNFGDKSCIFQVGMDNEGEEDCIMMMWPVTIIHPIDEERSVISRIFKLFFALF